MTDLLFRAATPADREPLAELLDRCFPVRDFTAGFPDHFPHLFSAEAITQHHLAVLDGKLVGCVGCYRFAAVLNGQPLRVAGIGQVATDPQARSQGIMSRLLKLALDAATDVDLHWLYGDRQRYGRIGFVRGGRVIAANVGRQHLPAAADGPAIRELDPVRDGVVIERLLAGRPFSLQLPAADLSALLRGKRASGLTDGDACLLSDGSGTAIWATCGEVAAVGRLLARHLADRPALTAVTVLADADDTEMIAPLQAFAGDFSARPTANLRVGRLLPLLRAWARLHPAPPGAVLRPCALDGGTAGQVRIACIDGAWRIEHDHDPADLLLAGTALSELVFGFLPQAQAQVPPDSVLTHLLPLRFAIPECYAL